MDDLRKALTDLAKCSGSKSKKKSKVKHILDMRKATDEDGFPAGSKVSGKERKAKRDAAVKKPPVSATVEQVKHNPKGYSPSKGILKSFSTDVIPLNIQFNTTGSPVNALTRRK